jgi:hypothetical protein
LGACGIINKDTDNIVAAAHDFFDSFPCVFRQLYVLSLGIRLITVTFFHSGYDVKKGNPNTNPICGKRVSMSCMYLARPVLFYLSFDNTRILDNGKTAIATIRDRCGGCNYTDLDMSTAVMSKLVKNFVDVGRIYGLEWTIL